VTPDRPNFNAIRERLKKLAERSSKTHSIKANLEHLLSTYPVDRPVKGARRTMLVYTHEEKDTWAFLMAADRADGIGSYVSYTFTENGPTQSSVLFEVVDGKIVDGNGEPISETALNEALQVLKFMENKIKQNP